MYWTVGIWAGIYMVEVSILFDFACLGSAWRSLGWRSRLLRGGTGAWVSLDTIVVSVVGVGISLIGSGGAFCYELWEGRQVGSCRDRYGVYMSHRGEYEWMT